MLTQENDHSSLITSEFLSSLDKDQLNDLFHHKNKLLTIALLSGIKFRDYIISLKKEIELIETALNCHSTKQLG